MTALFQDLRFALRQLGKNRVFITTLVAGYLPALRATRIDPLVALRYE